MEELTRIIFELNCHGIRFILTKEGMDNAFEVQLGGSVYIQSWDATIKQAINSALKKLEEEEHIIIRPLSL